MPVLPLVAGRRLRSGHRLLGRGGAAVKTDEYMTKVQETFLKNTDLHALGAHDVMFRVVDAQPLVPRWRVEVGIPTPKGNVLLTNMKMKDPKMTGMHFASYVNTVLIPALQVA